MKYKVDILETLKRTVTVEAESADAARNIVMGDYFDAEYILGNDDFYDVEFEPVEI